MRRANNDAFSRCHPLVTFVFFLGAVGFGALIMHPAYILASGLFAVTYYCLLRGSKGIKMVGLSIPVFLFLTFAKVGVMTSDKFMTLFGSVIPTISLLLLMVLRLVPNMIRKIAQLAGARKCIGRGAAENATKREKAVDSLNVLSALMTWALEGGVITADSMRSRGYGTEKRTAFQIQKLKKLDVVLLSVMAVLATVIAGLIAGGGTAADYTPIMKITPVTGKYLLGFAAYCVFLSLPTVLYIKEAIQWRISRSGI